jgi:alkylation response protein AidB-like acyl-CoA dehydrogenase
MSAEVPSEFVDSVRRVVREEAARQSGDRPREGQPGRFWKQAADLGWTHLLAGGDVTARDGVLYCAVIAAALGDAAIETPFFGTAVEAAILMSHTASGGQRDRHLRPALAGERVLPVALYEPGGDETLLSPLTVCRQTAGGYRLKGTKLLVPYAQHAPAMLCTATVATKGLGELACFMVPSDAPGVSIEPLRTSAVESMCAVTFTDVRLAEGDRLSQGDVLIALEEMLAVGAALNCTQLYGIGRRALELTIAFASERHQFGKPIGSLQAVQHHIVDMYKVLEQTRVLTVHALMAVLERGRLAIREVALAKIKAGEGIPALLRMAHQIHGGVGYYFDYPLASLYTATMAAQASYGSTVWHRKRLSALVADEPSALLPGDAHGRRTAAGV